MSQSDPDSKREFHDKFTPFDPAVPNEGIRIVLAPAAKSGPARAAFEKAIAAESAIPFEACEAEQLKIRWRSGLAIIDGSPADADEVIPAIVEYARWETKLREMEFRLSELEEPAKADVKFAYTIVRKDRKEWPRIRARMEELYTMRLAFADLEPRLSKPARSLPLRGRKLAARMAKRADVEFRLEAFSNRLETLEDLYEGASDRINDYRMYRDGHRLEILIIALLALEVVLMAGELYLRYQEYITPAE